jgi:hypothetical protein
MNRKKATPRLFLKSALAFAPPILLLMQAHFSPYAKLYLQLTMVDLPSFQTKSRCQTRTDFFAPARLYPHLPGKHDHDMRERLSLPLFWIFLFRLIHFRATYISISCSTFRDTHFSGRFRGFPIIREDYLGNNEILESRTCKEYLFEYCVD